MGERRIMRKFGIVRAVILILLFSPAPALANQPPGPQILLAEVLILPVMILLSLIGGTYAVRKVSQDERPHRRGILLVLGAILAILVSAAHEGLGAVVAVVFGIIALKRGGEMLMWGFGALKRKQRETEPVGVSPGRMIPAGIILMLVTLFLMGMAAAFVGYWPGIDQNRRERALVEYMASKMAYIRLSEGDADGVVPSVPPEGPLTDRFFDHYGDIVKVVSDEGGEGFIVYVLPGEFPFFPYNYLTAQPSYRGDETGDIRMIYVHHSDRLCPEDAPVVLTVNDEDIERAMEGLTEEKTGEDT